MAETYTIFEARRGGGSRMENTPSLERVRERITAAWKARRAARATSNADGRTVAEAGKHMPHVDDETGRKHCWGWWRE